MVKDIKKRIKAWAKAEDISEARATELVFNGYYMPISYEHLDNGIEVENFSNYLKDKGI